MIIRCPLCAGLNHRDEFEEFRICKLCCLGFRPGRALPPLEAFRAGEGWFEFPNWNTLRTRLTRRLPPGSPDFVFSVITVRMFAAHQSRRTAAVRTSTPLGGSLPWSYGGRIRARLEAWPSAEQVAAIRPDPRLTLGVITTPDAQPATLDLCADMAGTVRDIIVVLDTTDPRAASDFWQRIVRELDDRVPGHISVIARPLARDFAAQRNAIQGALNTRWVLQLDSDERLGLRAKARLRSIIDDAERQRLHAVALPRRNMVDGQLSALYPDIQYRLLRREVRFTRPVHEHPDLAGRVSAVHLGPGIIHTIAGERLDRRATAYEGILEGAGRPDDTALLRRPLEAAVRLPVEALG